MTSPQAPLSKRYVIADVFTDRRFAGNPLGVFPDAVGIDDETMQRIARELNLSETVFVLPAADKAHFRRVRIFTPSSELAFAGHPTIGSAIVIANLFRTAADSLEFVLEEGIGPVPVVAASGGGQAAFTIRQPPDIHASSSAPVSIATALSLEHHDLAGEPFIASCGTPFLFVPVASLEALGRAAVDTMAWRDAVRRQKVVGAFLYVMTGQGEGGVEQARARMFAPDQGVPEDPATGSAATALVGALAPELAKDGVFRLDILQGVEMGRPSLIQTETQATDGIATAMTIRGKAVIVAEGVMTI
jgi:trans-2,3-dihydro-3-hydroxyanthranilate isomerase